MSKLFICKVATLEKREESEGEGEGDWPKYSKSRSQVTTYTVKSKHNGGGWERKKK
jgi:hypothetical protein